MFILTATRIHSINQSESVIQYSHHPTLSSTYRASGQTVTVLSEKQRDMGMECVTVLQAVLSFLGTIPDYFQGEN